MTTPVLTHGQSAFVLATAAYNEESNIERVLSSVARQSKRPKLWVIVSDGSIDRTDAIVQSYVDQYEFIKLHRINKPHERNFAAQAVAINRGFSLVREIDYRYIGNLDADISLDSDYFERLISKFESNDRLGLAGGYIYESSDGMFRSRKTNSINSVPHGVQMFRRECFAALGGYVPLPYGGPDWHAEVTARRAGWKVQSFPDLKCYHHRVTGGASGRVKYCFGQGFMDYSLGTDPWFEAAKLARRVSAKPYFLGATARLAGFLLACLRKPKRPVSADFISYLRAEQRSRLRDLFSRAAGFGTDESGARLGKAGR